MLTLGEKLRKLREERGWTLSEAASIANVSLSHVSAIENGTRPNPSFFVMVRLAEAYGVELSYFADDSNEAAVPFKAAETSSVYQEIAQRLQAANALEDPSRLLEVLAQYLRDRPSAYDDETN